MDRKSGRIQLVELDGEEIQNAIAVSEDGVFVVSDFALYRFEADAETGVLTWTWRKLYDRSTNKKPGLISQGLGTTPTLLGDDLIAIVDNANVRVNVCVYRRAHQVTKSRLIIKQPVFEPNCSATENSLIGYRNSLICVNNFGYTTPFQNPQTEPGVVRIDISEDQTSHSVIWKSGKASQTTVPKLSVGNGLVYLYTRRKEETRKQAWYLTAMDFCTGETVFEVFTGTGILYNNNWAPITIGPNGTSYVGALNGIIAVYDGDQDEPSCSHGCCIL